MTTTLTVRALEDSTYVATFAFTDENGDAVTPNSITWTLLDVYRRVVNGREDVVVAAPAASVDIVLSGDDLEPYSAKETKLLMTVTADYDSSLGLGLPLIDQCWIPIDALKPWWE